MWGELVADGNGPGIHNGATNEEVGLEVVQLAGQHFGAYAGYEPLNFHKLQGPATMQGGNELQLPLATEYVYGIAGGYVLVFAQAGGI